MVETGILKSVAVVDHLDINNQADVTLGMKVATLHTQRDVALRLSKLKKIFFVI